LPVEPPTPAEIPEKLGLTEEDFSQPELLGAALRGKTFTPLQIALLHKKLAATKLPKDRHPVIEAIVGGISGVSGLLGNVSSARRGVENRLAGIYMRTMTPAEAYAKARREAMKRYPEYYIDPMAPGAGKPPLSGFRMNPEAAETARQFSPVQP
jgi:hypothetical protein